MGRPGRWDLFGFAAPIHPIRNRLRLGRRGEDRARVVFQDLEPGGEVGSVIGARVMGGP